MGAEGNGAVLFGLYAHLLLHSVPEEEKEAANGKEAVCSAVRNRSPALENARFFEGRRRTFRLDRRRRI